jgi:hypothetical protein
MQVMKAPLRKFMPHADGKADPMQWWVLDDGAVVGGPFDRAREAWACADREAKEKSEGAA